MSYASNDTASNDPVFRQQVRQAILVEAVTVAAEGSGVTNHLNRSTLATSLLTQFFDERLTTWTRAVASDGATLPGATDAAILTRVSALWNAFAGGL